MKSLQSFLLLFVCLIMLSCCNSVSISDSEISNLNVSIKETKNSDKLITITGNSGDSALFIQKYSIIYKKDSVLVSIKKTLKDTGISIPYFLQFVVNPEVRSIYIQKKLLWTSSVSDYFVSKHYTLPITFIRDYNYKIVNTSKGEQDGTMYKKEIDDFYKYLQKSININKCITYCKDADGFVFSNPFIYEEGEERFYAINIYAYVSGNRKTTIPSEKVDINDITKFHNIMIYGFNEYDEKGWVF